jgi:LysR family cys regulon transcriptional activator
MTLQSLRYFCEIARQGWNISLAAKMLHTSQPGVSRQMHALERELGVRLFTRSRNRITGLTGPGREVLAMATRILTDAGKLKALGKDNAGDAGGSLTVAATHTQARYVLPDAVKRFTRAHPEVQLYLKQGIPTELVRLVAQGDADFSVSAVPTRVPDEVVSLPCFDLERVVIVPARHPLLKVKRLTLEALARYPLITYDDAFSMREGVMSAFRREGLSPKVVINAVDADVMKTYAAAGLGIAIVPEVAYNARADSELRAIRAGHLVGKDTICLCLRRHNYLRGYVYDFIRLFAPSVSPQAIAEAIDLRL